MRRQPLGEPHELDVARPWEDALARDDEREGRAADEVQQQRAGPELPELEPGCAAAPLKAGDRDEEVLGEELRLADDDEDEADPERGRAHEVAELRRGDRPGHERERDDAEGDVEAADERGRDELDDRPGETPLSLLPRPRVDLLGLPLPLGAHASTSSRRAWYALAWAPWIRGMCSDRVTTTWSASRSDATRPPS